MTGLHKLEELLE